MISQAELQRVAIQRVAATMITCGSPIEMAAANRYVSAHKFIFSFPIKVMLGAIDFASDLSEHGLLKLPYQSVVFACGEMSSEPDNVHIGGFPVVLAWEEDGVICGRVYHACKDIRATSLQHGTIRLPHGRVVPRNMQSASVVPDNCVTGLEETAARMFTMYLMSCLGVLNSRGIEVIDKDEPKLLNKKRAKKGKVPIFGYKIVGIDYERLKVPGTPLGGSHSSPRLHWRRGHVRRLFDGRHTIVRPCLVGDPANGAIVHDYHVHAA
jgi:hypothetical protein